MKKFTHDSNFERMGASLGLWAVLWFVIQYVILAQTTAVPFSEESKFIVEVSSESMKWEWITFFRVMGGLVFLWFMGSVLERFHAAEGDPGRLAYVGFSLGITWGIVWLLSAFLNSMTILLATGYQHAEGAQLSAVLAMNILDVLTGPVMFALLLATSYIGFRFHAFRTWYNYVTALLTLIMLVLTLIQWYGSGMLGDVLMAVSLLWVALTSIVLLLDFGN